MTSVVVISGSPRPKAKTQIMMRHVYERCLASGCQAKFVNLSEDGFDYFRGHEAEYGEVTKQAVADIMAADVWLVGTPIYNSFFSAALKNLFEFCDYKKTPGKVAGMAILASGNIGFIDVQTLLTQLMSYFRVTANPNVVYATADAFSDDAITSDDVKSRLDNLVKETLDLASKLV